MFDFLFPKKRFVASRLKFWDSNAQSFKQSQDCCVGSWDEQEAYPYTEYLLENYTGPRGKAYDFGCGVGRMMKHMLAEFSHVDGGELVPNNITFAKEYLKDHSNFNIFQLDGNGALVGEPGSYDFIYSTIVIHHIAPYSIREQIYKDFYVMLKPGAMLSTQIVFGIDTGIHWFDNPYDKIVNGTVDVSVPDESHLPKIKKWLESLGFIDVTFRIKYCPHKAAVPELKWLFVDAKKPG